MSVACASPVSNGGVHDVLRSRMRIDTNAAYERQQDEQSLLSAVSHEDITGLSPGSYVNISPDDLLDFHASASDRAFGSDLDMNDWTLMSPSPHSPYNNPRSVSGDSNAHSHQDAAPRVPRNRSFTSSLSSAAQSGAHMISPYTSSPEDHFASMSFLQPPSTQHASMDQQALADLFTFTASQAQHPVSATTAPAQAYTSRVPRHVASRYPNQMAYHTTSQGLPIQDPWANQAHIRMPYTADSGAPLFGLDYTPYSQQFPPFSAQPTAGPVGAEQSISPRTRDNTLNQPQWPLNPFQEENYLDQDLFYSFTGGADLQRTTSFPHSLTSSDVGPSKPPPEVSDDVRTGPSSLKKSITPPVVIKEEEQPYTAGAKSRVYRFEPYATPASAQPQQPQIGPRRPTGQSRRVGGRQLGTKFEAAKAERIKERREDGACWVCSLQRDEVRHPPSIVIWMSRVASATSNLVNLGFTVFRRRHLPALHSSGESA